MQNFVQRTIDLKTDSNSNLPNNQILQLKFSMVIDNCRIRGQNIDSLPFAVKFPIENIDFIVHPKTDELGNSIVLLFGQAQYELSEWKYLIQLRIKTGTAEKGKGVRVVDRLLVEIGNRLPPVMFHIADAAMGRIKFEIRIINKLYERLPTFQKGGDIVLLFNGGVKLCVDKSLLALHSRYMASVLYDAEDQATVDMCSFDYEAFLELLYQIYNTARPVSAELFKLAKAAVGYNAETVLKRITKFISDLEVELIDKLRIAVELKLDDTLSELVYDAEQRGLWADLIAQGFEPKCFGDEIYQRLICPAIMRARQNDLSTDPYSLYSQIHLHMPQKPYTVPLLVSGKIFHVNKGILALHNFSGTSTGIQGELILRITSEIAASCSKVGIDIVDLVLKMLQFIYPNQLLVPGPYIRPMMLLAEEHGMKRLLNYLCEMLALEPALQSKTMLEHFELASRYRHSNLFNANLLRIEGSFKERAENMFILPEFRKLPEEFQKKIMERHSSGWALNDQRLANVPTTNLQRIIALNWGGAAPKEADKNIKLATFQGLNSPQAFGSVKEMSITTAQK